MNGKRKKPYVIDVGDNQVFSADFVFEQMQAQDRMQDRTRRLAIAALLIAICAVVIAVVAIAR